MRHAISIVAAVAASVMLSGAAHAAIVITEVDPYSSSTIVGADWFELTNNGPSAVDIAGWKVDDNSNSFAASVALLGITSIAPGQAVIFIESPNPAIQAQFVNEWFGGTAPAGFSMGYYSGSGIGLSTSGDAINIYNAAGVLQANVLFGAANVGFTFDNTAGLNATTISQLSAAGVNGAFFSGDGRVGSPGVTSVVPVPAAAWLLGSAFGLLAVVRRRAA